MKKLLIAVFAVAALASCKKESVNNLAAQPGSGVAKKMKSITSVYDNSTPETDFFAYDTKGRLISYTSGDDVTSFDYSNPVKVIATEKTNNVITRFLECDVNAKGLITKVSYKKPDGTLDLTSNYEYNTEDYMIMSDYVYSSGSTSKVEYGIVNGNPVSKKFINDGVQTGTSVSTFDDSINYTGEYAIGGAFASPMFGKKAKNPVTSAKAYDNNNTIYFHSEYTNTANAEGYFTGYNVTNKLNGKTGTTTYQY